MEILVQRLVKLCESGLVLSFIVKRALDGQYYLPKMWLSSMLLTKNAAFVNVIDHLKNSDTEY